MTADDFVRRFLPVALKVQAETNIFADAMLTQSALETGWGNHVKGNNYFGIKSGRHGKRQLIRTKEILSHPHGKFPIIHGIEAVTINGKQYYRYDIDDFFFYYDNPIDSFRAYADFIRDNPRYRVALRQTTAESYLIEVARAGYATDVNYADTLLKVLQSVRKRIPK